MNEQARNYLANKYASAFLNVFFEQLTLDDVTYINEAVDFLTTNHKIIFLLQLPMIEASVKKENVSALCQKLKLPSCIERLCHILIGENRLFLLVDILPKIYNYYFVRAQTLEFTFSSYPAIDNTACNKLKEFLADKTGCDIIYEYKLDKTLIAGIRLQSDTFLWEHSLAQQIKRLQLPLD